MAGVIGYSNSLINFLESSLATAFNQPSVQLTRKSRKAGASFQVRMIGGDRDALIDDSIDQSVTQICLGGGVSTSFYLGFVAVFEVAVESHALRHSSISVFHDIGGELMPLFRADWDELAAADKTSILCATPLAFHSEPAGDRKCHPGPSGAERRLLTPPSGFAFEGAGRLRSTPLCNDIDDRSGRRDPA